MKIALINCSWKHSDYPFKKTYLPTELYGGSMFKLRLTYAKTNCDKIFILSAKYGLLSLHDTIKPYNVYLKQLSEKEYATWNKKVLQSLSFIQKQDEIILLCNHNYYDGWINSIQCKKTFITKQFKNMFYERQWLIQQLKSKTNKPRFLEDV